MNRSILDFWVGIFVALGLAAIIFIALRVANQSSFYSSPSYTVTAYFNNVGGLKVRAPVKSAGVTIGRVTAIKLDKQSYQAAVSLALDEQYDFSSDSSASILTAGVLGEQYIGLETGAEEDTLQDGDAIYLTSSALLLEKIVSEFGLKNASEKSSGDANDE